MPSVAIGKDGTIYATGGSRLKAIYPENGAIIWSFSPGPAFPSSSVILIDIDGGICAGNIVSGYFRCDTVFENGNRATSGYQ
ncbi:MAG TPA: hypothetical protein PK165_05625 [bacterium]|nr:hypothetical protein [bacterium]HOL35615.1 hypothetical protein [bacterium]HPO52292.1 hypothetical protein [bacterium]